MKHTLMRFGVGSCMLLALASCSSTDDDGFSAYEEAQPMSEYELAEDVIPPWLIDDPEVNAQVKAGSQSMAANRNQFAIPEPGKTVADTSGTVSMGQNQGYSKGGDVVVVETPPEIVANPVIDTPKPVVAPKPVVRKKSPKKIKKPTMVVYKVRAGDNLSVIAARSGTTVSAIRKASGISGSLIHPGQKIKIPYTPKGYEISKRGISTKTHTVRSGETIDSIARRNGLGYKQLLQANRMTESEARRLRVGRKLIIPKR